MLFLNEKKIISIYVQFPLINNIIRKKIKNILKN